MKNITLLLRQFPFLLISDIILNISHIIQIICLILNKIRKINVFTSQVFFYIPHCGIHKWIKILIFYYVVNWFWLDKKLRSPGSQSKLLWSSFLLFKFGNYKKPLKLKIWILLFWCREVSCTFPSWECQSF